MKRENCKSGVKVYAEMTIIEVNDESPLPIKCLFGQRYFMSCDPEHLRRIKPRVDPVGSLMLSLTKPGDTLLRTEAGFQLHHMPEVQADNVTFKLSCDPPAPLAPLQQFAADCKRIADVKWEPYNGRNAVRAMQAELVKLCKAQDVEPTRRMRDWVATEAGAKMQADERREAEKAVREAIYSGTAGAEIGAALGKLFGNKTAPTDCVKQAAVGPLKVGQRCLLDGRRKCRIVSRGSTMLTSCPPQPTWNIQFDGDNLIHDDISPWRLTPIPDEPAWQPKPGDWVNTPDGVRKVTHTWPPGSCNHLMLMAAEFGYPDRYKENKSYAIEECGPFVWEPQAGDYCIGKTTGERCRLIPGSGFPDRLFTYCSQVGYVPMSSKPAEILEYYDFDGRELLI